MKKLVALALACLMILSAATAFAVPSKTTNDIVVEKVELNPAVEVAEDFTFGTAAVVTEEAKAVVAQKKVVIDTVLAKVAAIAAPTTEGTVAVAPVVALVLGNKTNIKETVPAAAASTVAQTALADTLFATFGAEVFGADAAVDAATFENDSEKQVELLSKLSVDDVIQVNVENYDVSYGEITAAYETTTVYTVDEKVQAMLMCIDEATEETTFLPLNTTVQYDGTLVVTYSVEALTLMQTEGIASAIVIVSLEA